MGSREDLVKQEQLNKQAIIDEARRSEDQKQRERAEKMEQERKNQDANYKK